MIRLNIYACNGNLKPVGANFGVNPIENKKRMPTNVLFICILRYGITPKRCLEAGYYYQKYTGGQRRKLKFKNPHFAFGRCHLYFAASNLKMRMTKKPNTTATLGLNLFKTAQMTAPIMHGQA